MKGLEEEKATDTTKKATKKEFWEVLPDIWSPGGCDPYVANEIFKGKFDDNDAITALFAYLLRQGNIPEDKKPQIVEKLLLEAIDDNEACCSYLPELAKTFRELGGYKIVLDKFSASKPFSEEWQVCWKLLGEMLQEEELLPYWDYNLKNVRLEEVEEEVEDE